MKKLAKRLFVGILYKNHEYKVISVQKLKRKDLYKSDVKMIMIPCADDPNVYIPIRPNPIYEFYRATVKIEYETFVYDLEEGIGNHFDTKTYEKECFNIIDFVNAIYNTYKFRGTSMYIEGNIAEGQQYIYPQWAVYSRRIRIKFYDTANRVIDSIDSGDMGRIKDKDVHKAPPPYCCEDRLECLNDILYTPCDRRGGKLDGALQRLPICIQTKDDGTWKRVAKPGRDLTSDDLIFYKLDDFCAYYFLNYSLYKEILAMNHFDIHIISSPIHPIYDTEYLPSLKTGDIPSQEERLRAMEAYLRDDIVSLVTIKPEIASVNGFLVTKAFFICIIYYVHYFATLAYGEEDPSCRLVDLIIFTRTFQDTPTNRILTLQDLNYQKTTDMFSEMLTSRY